MLNKDLLCSLRVTLSEEFLDFVDNKSEICFFKGFSLMDCLICVKSGIFFLYNLVILFELLMMCGLWKEKQIEEWMD